MGRTRVKPEAQRLAGGYLRVSDPRKQGDNYSPGVQREKIEALARREGMTVVRWESDQERGRRTLERPGYMRLLEAARSGELGAIIVNHTNRWGRRTAEMVERLDELDAGGVAFYSVAQGRLRPGIVSTLLFALDEQFCRDLAHVVRPARQAGARAGVHQGPTPFGYKRVYPAWDGSGKRPPGELVVDEACAPVVQQMFRRYAEGATCRELALWLNLELRVPPPRAEHTRCTTWADDTVYQMLRNPTYVGIVPYDRRGQGFYERAAEGDYFESPGRHEPLVGLEVWAAVRARLQHRPAAPQGGRPERQRTKRLYLGAGLLVCRACGGPMRVHSSANVKGHKGTYLCWGALRGRALCHEPGYRMDLAHEALLREVGRLRGSPWTPTAERRLRGHDEGAQRASALRRAIAEEQGHLLRHMELLTRRAQPGPAELEAYEALVQQIEGRIAALQGQLREMERAPDRVPDLRALHEELTHTELRDLFSGLDAQRDEVDCGKVRRIVVLCVGSATLAERKPERYSTWLRMDVTWTPRVEVLLREGLLRLEDATGQLLCSQEFLDDA